MLKSLTRFIQEIVDIYTFFRKIPQAEKAIVLYVENENYYAYLEGLVTALTGQYDLSVCYITSSPEDPILQTTNPRIKPLYVKTLLPFFMIALNCRVCVMTLTDLNQFSFKRSIEPVHYVYAFHSLVSTHMMYRHGAFDHYDAILCCGPHQVQEIRQYETCHNRTPKQLIEAGYYRLERIYEAFRSPAAAPSPSDIKGTILIAPSWGEENVLESCGERLCTLLLEAGYAIIVRPHPETVKRSPELLALLTSVCGRNPNFTLETSVATDDALLRADVLITDCSGIALEYAFGTERPILFLDVPLKIKNQHFRELNIEPVELFLRPKIGQIVSPEHLETVPQTLEALIEQRAAYADRIIELRTHYVYHFGQSSKIGAQYIYRLVTKKIDKIPIETSKS